MSDDSNKMSQGKQVFPYEVVVDFWNSVLESWMDSRITLLRSIPFSCANSLQSSSR